MVLQRKEKVRVEFWIRIRHCFDSQHHNLCPILGKCEFKKQGQDMGNKILVFDSQLPMYWLRKTRDGLRRGWPRKVVMIFIWFRTGCQGLQNRQYSWDVNTVGTETLGQTCFFLRQRETWFENLKTTHRVDLDKPKVRWPWCCLLNPVSNLLWHVHAAVGPYRRVVCLQNLKMAEKIEIDIYPPRQLFPASPKLGVLVYNVYTPYI